MPFLLCYTKQGSDHYRDVNDAVHLALCQDGIKYVPLRNNTAILFPKADLEDGSLAGCSKTLLDPWLFRFADGTAGIIAVRRNKMNAPDTKHKGAAIIFSTKDFVHYEENGFILLNSDGEEVKQPRCIYDPINSRYLLEWKICHGVQAGLMTGETRDFISIKHTQFMAPPHSIECQLGNDVHIPHGVLGNSLEISPEEAEYIHSMLSVVYHNDVSIPELTLQKGGVIAPETLPQATCIYSDSSTHEKKVRWDLNELANVDINNPGDYQVSGEIQLKTYPVPFIVDASDPCVFHHRGKYYFTSSARQVTLRESDTVDGLQTAEKIIIYKDSHPKTDFWAQELHLIDDVPYIFTSICPEGNWTEVQSVIFQCHGEIGNPEDWEGPVYVVKPDGSPLMETGISLDMTYFEIDGVHYVSWSNREMNPEKDMRNENSTNGTADIYMATIDPQCPWQLITDPVCISRADYGWSRLETDVEEGPFLLRHGDDLFITISGASVGSVYCLGLLHAEYGSDLLSPDSWEKIPYPLLTRESVPGQHGPGHNNFFKDPENGVDDWMAVLYRPLAEWYEATYDLNKENPRNAALRRIHWNKNGYPNLEMYPNQDLNPDLKDVILTIHVV